MFVDCSHWHSVIDHYVRFASSGTSPASVVWLFRFWAVGIPVIHDVLFATHQCYNFVFINWNLQNSKLMLRRYLLNIFLYLKFLKIRT